MNNRAAILVMLVCGALFALGLYQLFRLRYEVGDVYPEYSSLRADPLGTMILYESLQKSPGISVRRDFAEANTLPDGRRTTYLHLAASRLEWNEAPEELVRELERFLTQGGRLVVAFAPETTAPASLRAPVVTTTPPPKKQSQRAQEQLLKRTSLAKRWGADFSFRQLDLSTRGAHAPVRVTRQADLPLPQHLHWHSGMVFANVDEAWHTIYARGTNAVLLERRFGPGSIVLASDSYFFSNQAQNQDRHADLLAWFIASGSHVIFDEAHLGIVESTGVADLMRRYRLHALAIGVLLLAGLFIWKNSVSFVPPFPEQTGETIVSGRDAVSGLVNLLRRNLDERDLLRLCFDEWTKALVHIGSHSINRVDQAQAILEAEHARARADQDPLRAYRQICEVLKVSKRKS